MKQNPFLTPILFLIFNRPDTTIKVFEKIREIQPRRLFVSADGPRAGKLGERQKCEEARHIVKNIDWKCEIKTHYSDTNLGCGIGVSSGINWFFKNVQEGIILEDDCLPDLTFFQFCATLLDYYRNDDRVMHIGGVNFQDDIVRGDGAYYFSKLNHIWGWATWKRAWEKYDMNISKYPQLLERHLLSAVCESPSMRKYWKKNFDLVYKKEKDTWDLQWQFALFINNGLAILPNKNLISNIGFDQNATHTIDNLNSLSNRPTTSLDIITHPLFMIPDHQADFYSVKKYMNPNKIKKLWQLIRRIATSS